VADTDDVVRKSPTAPRLLSEIAYERVLEGLFAKKVPAGAFVSQNDLVKLLDIPVAPLRDALRVLEAEGVLTIHPRSGIQFIKPDLELTRSTYQFRSILERAAVRVYAEMADEAEVGGILDRHNALIDLIAAQGLTPAALAGLEEVEVVFHGCVIDILKNPLITSNYRRMANYLRLLRLDRRLTPPLALRTLREHVDILTACQRRDPDAAEAALNRHFQAALQRNLGFF
jgi:DNA-binding GntR family transcriptional regulator